MPLTGDAILADGGSHPDGGAGRVGIHPLTFTTPDRHQPVSPKVGPFAKRHFLDTVWRHTALPGQVPVVLAGDEGEVVLVEEPGAIGLLGHEDLVDYRSPLGDTVDLLADRFSRLEPGLRFRFDSLPEGSARVFAAALDRAGVIHRSVRHTATALLELPGSFDDYLMSIGKKERHETRRKRRRFEAALGPPRIVTFEDAGPVLEDFFRLHRRSSGSKGSFMTERMAGMFADLLGGAGWRLDALYGAEPRLVAAVIGYSDGSGYYLYNSAYDPELSHASPGVVLLSELIRMAIGGGLEVFDFLKGEETYKLRMGARRRPLFVVEGPG